MVPHPTAGRSVLLALLFLAASPQSWAENVRSGHAASAVASAANPNSVGVWTSGGPYGGLIQALAINPKSATTLYAGTFGNGPQTPVALGPPPTRASRI